MTVEEMDALQAGEKYEIVVNEDPIFMGKLEKKTYVAEFRGFEPVDLFELPQYLLFWVEGESKASEFYYGDIVRATKLKVKVN
jgi:hypothetical protein